MTTILVLLIGYSTLVPRENPGVYAMIPLPDAVLRVDTRSGAIERCIVADNAAKCTRLEAK